MFGGYHVGPYSCLADTYFGHPCLYQATHTLFTFSMQVSIHLVGCLEGGWMDDFDPHAYIFIVFLSI